MRYTFAIFFVLSILLLADTKYFLPINVVASNGRPINNANVDLYTAGTSTKVYDLTYQSQSAGGYYHTSAITAGIYDVYVDGVLWRTRFGINTDTDVSNVVADTAAVLRSEWNSDISDSLAQISDSLHVVDDSTLEEYSNGRKFRVKDNGITWGKLSTAVQSVIAGELYSYQDAAINSELQMLVRFQSYLFENYWNDDSTACIYPYDQSGPNYELDRRGPVRYLYLLMELHRLTGRSIYWNKMVTLYGQLLSSAGTKAHNGGVKTCYTIIINPDSPNEREWPFADVRFHIVGKYIADGDATYSDYETYFNDFVDVITSYVDSTTHTGFSWGYHWDEAPAGNARVNTMAPILTLYQYCNVNGITTDSVSATYIDRVCDSLWGFLESTWIDDAGSGGGGYPLRVGDASIDYSYINVYVSEFARITNMVGDTTWADNCGDRILKLAKYRMRDISTNYYYLNEGYDYSNYLLKKLADAYNLNYGNVHQAQSVGGNFLYRAHFEGYAYRPTLVAVTPREALTDGVLPELLYGYNNANYNEVYDQKADPATWAGDAASFYYKDGVLARDRSSCGLVIGTPDFKMGFQHGDALGVANHETDTTYWAFNTTTGTMKYFLPDTSKSGGDTLSNGKRYQITKIMGTPYKVVNPMNTLFASVTDSIRLSLDSTNFASGDSLYLFYYNSLSQYDTLRLSTLSVGDTLVVKGNLGIYVNHVGVQAPANGDIGLGFICNKSTTNFIRRPNITKYWQFTTGLVDSAMFYTHYHKNNNALLNSSSYWPEVKAFFQDVLEHAQRQWNNLYRYDGILENKLQ